MPRNSGNVGHADDRVNAAVRAQLDRLSHVSTLYPTLPVVELAERLGVTQPAVSLHIRQLETALGLPLLERLGKRVVIGLSGGIVSSLVAAVIYALVGWALIKLFWVLFYLL